MLWDMVCVFECITHREYTLYITNRKLTACLLSQVGAETQRCIQQGSELVGAPIPFSKVVGSVPVC